MAVASSLRRHSPETREKCGAVNRGRALTPEHRAKISASEKGRQFSPEHRAKISAGQTGRTFSDAQLAKMRGRPVPLERRARISATLKARLRDHGVRIENVKRLRTPPLPKGECVYCGDSATTWDHVVPLCRGGAYGAENRVPACKPCNSSKGTRTPDEWLAAGLRALPGSASGGHPLAPLDPRRPPSLSAFASPGRSDQQTADPPPATNRIAQESTP